MTTPHSVVFFFFFALSLFLCSPTANCQNLDELVQSYGKALSNSSSSSETLLTGIAMLSHPEEAKCLEKLSPCKEFLHFEGPPRAACCDPIKEIVNNDTEDCACIFGSDRLLHSVNITSKDALALASACGAEPDLSGCENDSASAPSGSSTSTASFSLPPIPADVTGSGDTATATSTDSSSSSSSDEKKESSAAFGEKKPRVVFTIAAVLGLTLY